MVLAWFNTQGDTENPRRLRNSAGSRVACVRTEES